MAKRTGNNARKEIFSEGFPQLDTKGLDTPSEEVVIEAPEVEEKQEQETKEPSLSDVMKAISEQNKMIEQQNEIIEKQEKLIEKQKDDKSKAISSDENSLNLIETLAKAITSKTDVQIGSNLDEAGYKTKIDKEDVLDDPITFSCFGIGLAIGSFMDGSLEIMAPYGPMMFKYQGTDKNNQGDPRHYSVYMTRSKKEVSFLRDSPQYGRLFSENLNRTLSTEAQEHIRNAAIFDRVSNMTNTQIMQRCTSLKINYHGELSKLKDEIISKMIIESKKQDQDRLKRYSENQEKLQLIKASTL